MAKAGTFPRFLHALGDLRWLLYRLYGVPSHLYSPGISRGSDGWQPHGNWFCSYLHDGGQEVATIKRTPLHYRCHLLRQELAARTRGRTKFGRCGSGLRMASLPLGRRGMTAGTLLLGPYALGSRPTPAEIRRLARQAGIEGTAGLKWAASQIPLLDFRREREMVRTAEVLAARLLKRFTPTAAAEPWRQFSGTNFEPYSPPLRLGDDLPLTLFEAFAWTFDGGPSIRASLRIHLWEIIYVSRGEARFTAGGRQIRLAIDEACLIPPNTPCGRQGDGGSSSSGIQVLFAGQFPELARLALRPLPLNTHQRSLLREAADRMALNPQVPGNSQSRLALLHFLVSLAGKMLASSRDDDAKGNRENLIAMAKSYIEDSADRRITITELADHCRVSRFTLLHAFRRLTGISPLNYHSLLRMELAKRMLREDRKSVAMVAEQLQYSDYAPFSRLFRKIVGVPPAAYARGGKTGKAGKAR